MVCVAIGRGSPGSVMSAVRARDYAKPWRWWAWYPGWHVAPKPGGGVRGVRWPGDGWVLRIGLRAFESEGSCSPAWVPLLEIGTLGGFHIALDRFGWRDNLRRIFKPIHWIR